MTIRRNGGQRLNIETIKIWWLAIIFQVATRRKSNNNSKRQLKIKINIQCLVEIVSTTGNCDDASAPWCTTGVGWSIGHCGSSLGVTSSLTFDWQFVFEGRAERKSENLEVSKTQSIISASPPSTLVGNLQIESEFVVCVCLVSPAESFFPPAFYLMIFLRFSFFSCVVSGRKNRHSARENEGERARSTCDENSCWLFIKKDALTPHTHKWESRATDFFPSKISFSDGLSISYK